ncbi:hypothetical protein [Nonomuraea typhae]|uniref:hypothetical protein n=1 Tax=Nonomuraea typhae TaxID=2603600 RepID=UPI0012FA82CC|nr:hypothetical protein [Nonomuraea typhae]
MSVQALLAELINDPGLLDRLRADPGGFGVSRADALTLCAMDRRQFEITTLVHVERRRSWVRAKFPGSALLMAEQGTPELIARCVDQVRIRSTTPADFVAIGTHLRSLAGNHRLREMIRFETTWFELMLRPAPLAPMLAPGVAVLSFSFPVADLRQRLILGDDIATVTDRPAHYILQASSGRQIRTYPIGQELAGLLLAGEGLGERELTRLSRLGLVTWNPPRS